MGDCAPYGPDADHYQKGTDMTTTLRPARRPADLAGLLQTLSATGRFRLFLAAVAAAGLSRELSRGNLTIFAPSDWAFERLPAGAVRDLFSSRERLRAVLEGHIVAGVYPERDWVTATATSWWRDWRSSPPTFSPPMAWCTSWTG